MWLNASSFFNWIMLFIRLSLMCEPVKGRDDIRTEHVHMYMRLCVDLILWNYLFTFFIVFCKGLEMMGSDKIYTAACTYVHVLSLCHLYPFVLMSSLPFTIYLKNHKQMSTFKRYFSCAILLTTLHLAKRNELRYHCCSSATTVFHRALASWCYRKKE
jgi:hypothetical protein